MAGKNSSSPTTETRRPKAAGFDFDAEGLLAAAISSIVLKRTRKRKAIKRDYQR